MYYYVKAVSLSRSFGSMWSENNISSLIVKDIFANNTKVYLELTNPVLPNHVYVDLDVLRVEYSNYLSSLNQLLMDIGNRVLPTVPNLPNSDIKHAKYSDAIRSNYKITTTKIGVYLPENFPENEKTDLVIKRPMYDTDLSLLHSHCLISVNGYYHLTDTDNVNAYVYDGGKTMQKSKLNHLGILSFMDIGSVTKIPLLKDNINPQDSNSSLREKIYFNVTENLDNKSYILVLGGYLIFPSENVFYRNGTNSFVLDINNIPYIERIYESSMYLDLSSLELATNPINESMINIDELYSDRVIKNYMTLKQSFLVLVDIPMLVTNKIFLRHNDFPGMFTAYSDPTYPLIVNYGKVAEYWKTFEDGFWSVTVEDSFLRNYIFTQQPKYVLENVTNALDPSRPFWHSKGFLLEIAGYSI